MKIHLNGKTIESGSRTLLELIRENDHKTGSLVAEVNQRVIPQGQWESHCIRDGDRIELLNFVGGG